MLQMSSLRGLEQQLDTQQTSVQQMVVLHSRVADMVHLLTHSNGVDAIALATPLEEICKLIGSDTDVEEAMLGLQAIVHPVSI